MLVLSRRLGESVTIGDDIVVTVLEVNGNQVRVGIAAPRSVRILRTEIYQAMQAENRAAVRGFRHPRLLEEVVAHLRGERQEGEGE